MDNKQLTIQEINNIITMIGCNKSQFTNAIKNTGNKIFMTSGSRYTPFEIYDNNGLLLKYEYTGKLIFERS